MIPTYPVVLSSVDFKLTAKIQGKQLINSENLYKTQIKSCFLPQINIFVHKKVLKFSYNIEIINTLFRYKICKNALSNLFRSKNNNNDPMASKLDTSMLKVNSVFEVTARSCLSS